ATQATLQLAGMDSARRADYLANVSNSPVAEADLTRAATAMTNRTGTADRTQLWLQLAGMGTKEITGNVTYVKDGKSVTEKVTIASSRANFLDNLASVNDEQVLKLAGCAQRDGVRVDATQATLQLAGMDSARRADYLANVSNNPVAEADLTRAA